MQDDDNVFARDFSEVLNELRGGICAQELTDQLNAVTKACIETGKSGSITLVIKVLPQGSNQAIVAADVKAKVPAHTVQPTIMFVDDNSNLTRRNPRQMSLSEVVALEKNSEAVEVNKDTGEVVVVK